MRLNGWNKDGAYCEGWCYISILVGLIDNRPDLVTVLSGLFKISFSLTVLYVSLRFSKQLLINSQNSFPTSTSPLRHDISEQNVSSDIS